MKNYIKKINVLLKNIEEFETSISGFYANDILLKQEKKLEKIIDNLNLYTNVQIDEVLNETETLLNKRIEENKISLENTKNAMKEVIEKTEKNGGYICFHNPSNEKEIFKVAKIPFLIWCLESPYKYGLDDGDILYSLKEDLIKKWGETVSSIGEKLPNDNPYHSEWIRSSGIEPEDFYDFIDDEKNSWLKDLTMWYGDDFINFVTSKKYTTFDFDFIYNVNSENLQYVKSQKEFESFDFVIYEYFDFSNDVEININSIPYNINENSNFPIYFKPLYEGKSSLEEILNNKVVIVKNSDESINEIAINLSDFNNSVIFTNNSSKTAHLINISKDIKLNIFYIQDGVLKENNIYKLEKNGSIFLVTDNIDNIENIEIPLMNCENDHNNIVFPNKVKNIAKLHNLGFKHIPNGFFKIGEEKVNLSKEYYYNKDYNDINLIARSAGTNEGSSKASFSGLFHSEILTKDKDKNDVIIDNIFNSFKKPYVKKYCQKMNIDVPKIGIFYQEFIEADESFVIKINEDFIYIESFKGRAENIVNGSNETVKYFYDRKIKENYGTLINLLIKKCENIYTIFNKDLECEVIMKNFSFYFVQVI